MNFLVSQHKHFDKWQNISSKMLLCKEHMFHFDKYFVTRQAEEPNFHSSYKDMILAIVNTNSFIFHFQIL